MLDDDGAEFDSCPNCGHGMFDQDFRDPFECSACGLLVDGLSERVEHFTPVTTTLAGGRACEGNFVEFPSLHVDVVQSVSTDCDSLALLVPAVTAIDGAWLEAVERGAIELLIDSRVVCE